MNIVLLLKCYIFCTICMKIKKTNKKEIIHNEEFHSQCLVVDLLSQTAPLLVGWSLHSKHMGLTIIVTTFIHHYNHHK